MKIDFNNVKDAYRPGTTAIVKGNGKIFCPSCRKTLDEKNFFKTRRTDKHPSGFIPECKTCVALKVDDGDIQTFLPMLKEIDVPYMPSKWRELVQKKPAGGASIIGKYVSMMRMNQYKKYFWADTENLVESERNALIAAFKQDNATETDAEKRADEA